MPLTIKDIGVPVKDVDSELERRIDNSLYYSQQLEVAPETVFDVEPQLNQQMFGTDKLTEEPSKLSYQMLKKSISDKGVDIESIGTEFEQGFWSKVKASFSRGGQQSITDVAITEALYSDDQNNIDLALRIKDKVLNKEAQNPIEGSWLSEFLYANTRTAGQMWESLKAGGKGAAIVGGVGAVVGGVVGAVIPTIGEEPATVTAGAMIGLKAGTKLGLAEGAAIFSYRQGMGEMYYEMIRNDADPEIAKTVASVAAIPYALVEVAQLKALSPEIKKALARKLQGSIAKIVAEAAKKYGKTYSKEVAEEIIQKVISISARDTASVLSENDIEIDKTFLKERVQEVIDEGLGAAKGMALLPLPGAAIETGIHIVNSKEKPLAPVEVPETEGVAPTPPQTEIVAPEPTEAAPAVVAEVAKKKPEPTKEPIIKAEREALRDMGHTIPEIAKMELKAARRLLNKPVNADVYTPSVVDKEIPTKKAELTEESKNAPTVLEHYWREYDEREFEIDVGTQKNQAEIASALNKKTYLPDTDVETKDASLAMMLYIDLKEHPEGHKFAKEFTGKNQKIYEQSQSLSPKLQRIANKIIEQNRIAGELAVEQGVIKEARENYIAHLWERGPMKETFFARFRQKTARARQRQLEGGIAEGLSKGMKLRVQDVTLASQIAQSQVNQANVGKKLLKMGKDWGLLSHQQEADDWVQVEHPGFTTYRYRGTVELGADKPRGANIYVTDEGVVMEKVPVYAEPELGKKLNKIFSPSVIWKIPGAELVTRYNAIIKSTILYTSLFHHQAFLRSYAFGSHGINPVDAFKKGKEAIMNMEPEVRLLVRNGLTLGRIQDYDPRMLEGEDTIWGKVFALTEPTEKVNEWLQNQRRRQERFLFNKLGPYLKIQASLLELRAGLERNRAAIQRGEVTVDEIASGVATLMNNDFGGLHLGRMGRSNTVQHLMRLMLLAPDWTESNVRSMIDAFKKGETGYMHRMFWGRIAIKALGATVLFNLLMSAFDDEEFVERYRRAWKEGHLRWLDVDITPIYKALGGKTDSRKYFSLIGHFRDPVKFVSRPGRSLKHKGSVVSRMVFDFASGQDWAGRQYTTIGELLGISEEGKLQGRLVKWGRGKAQILEPEQLPSWFIYEGRQMMPIPIQNIAAFIAGEAEAFDAITKSMGLMTSTTYPEKDRSGRRTVTRRRSTRR